jgi:hypothetical protein
MIRKWLIPICLCVASGCVAATVALNVSPDYALEAANGKGIAVLSLSTNDEIQHFTVFARSNVSPGRIEIPLWNNRDPLDWKAPRGRLVAIEVPQGAYELYSWQTYGIGAGRPFSIPFKVVRGKISYVGNVYIEILTEENIFRVVVSDKSKRDLSLLLRKYPRIKAEDILIDGIRWGQVAKLLNFEWPDAGRPAN